MLLLVVIFALFAVLPHVLANSEWRTGRATFYGNEPWLWSIHDGACGYGYLYDDQSTGWNVAAISDSNDDFSGSCGRCYEIKCNPINFKDKFGAELERSEVCYDSEASLIVRATDACPCQESTNGFSNKRWCCGDMAHMDLSIWAFERLADTKWGVMALTYRDVPCDAIPAKEAPERADRFPGEDPPWDAERSDRWGASATDAQLVAQPLQAPTAGDASVLMPDSSWIDASWQATVERSAGKSWMQACATIQPGGALAFSGVKGDFEGKLVLQAWLQTALGNPDLTIGVSGDGVNCNAIQVQDLVSSETSLNGDWTKFNIYTGLFDEEATQQEVVAFAAQFTGCGGLPAGELTSIEIRNEADFAQYTCWADLRLLSG